MIPVIKSVFEYESSISHPYLIMGKDSYFQKAAFKNNKAYSEMEVGNKKRQDSA